VKWFNPDLEERSLPVGMQANLVLRQEWPPSFDELPLRYCGVGCRVVQILPWEYGTLPVSWMEKLSRNVDTLWAPSEYNRRVYIKSKYDHQRTAVVPSGIDCKTLIPGASSLPSITDDKESPDQTKPITFLFSGEMMPSKGVDILLDEWEQVFCNDSTNENNEHYHKRFDPSLSVRLLLHTTHEIGYSKHEINDMEKIISSCHNIEWLRNKHLKRKEFINLMRRSDVFIAPFRSNWFGVPIVEALAMGKTTIATVGGTASDDYMLPLHNSNHPIEYPISGAVETQCKREPCRGDKVCLFGKKCVKLVELPKWFEVDRTELRLQMERAYRDVSSQRQMNYEQNYDEDILTTNIDTNTISIAAPLELKENSGRSDYCWDELRHIYKDHAFQVLNATGHRSVPTIEMPSMFVLLYFKKSFIIPLLIHAGFALFLYIIRASVIRFAKRLLSKNTSYYTRKNV